MWLLWGGRGVGFCGLGQGTGLLARRTRFRQGGVDAQGNASDTLRWREALNVADPTAVPGHQASGIKFKIVMRIWVKFECWEQTFSRMGEYDFETIVRSPSLCFTWPKQRFNSRTSYEASMRRRTGTPVGQDRTTST